jgi:hypothetical protein
MYLHSNRRRVAAPKPPDSRLPTAGKAQARSRLSNGRDVLPNVDGRSLVARRYRNIICAVASDQGGAAQLSEARLPTHPSLQRHCCLAEQMESRLARGEQIKLSLLVQQIV